MPVYAALAESGATDSNKKNPRNIDDDNQSNVKDAYTKRRRIGGGNMRWTRDAVHLALIELVTYRENTLSDIYQDYTRRLPTKALEAVAENLAKKYPVAFGAVQPQTIRITFKAWFKRRLVWDALGVKGASRNELGQWMVTDSMVNELNAEFGEDAVRHTLEITSKVFPFKFEIEYLQETAEKVPLDGFLALMRPKTNIADQLMNLSRRAAVGAAVEGTQPVTATEAIDASIVDARAQAQEKARAEMQARAEERAAAQERTQAKDLKKIQNQAKSLAKTRLQSQGHDQSQVNSLAKPTSGAAELGRARPQKHTQIQAQGQNHSVRSDVPQLIQAQVRSRIPPPVLPAQVTGASATLSEAPVQTPETTPHPLSPSSGDLQSNFEDSEEEQAAEEGFAEIEHEIEQEAEQGFDQEVEQETEQALTINRQASSHIDPAGHGTPKSTSVQTGSTSSARSSSGHGPPPRIPPVASAPVHSSIHSNIEQVMKSGPHLDLSPRAIEQYSEDVQRDSLAAAQDPEMRETLVAWKLLRGMQPELSPHSIDHLLLICTLQPRFYKSIIACSLTADRAGMVSFLEAMARLTVSDLSRMLDNSY